MIKLGAYLVINDFLTANPFVSTLVVVALLIYVIDVLLTSPKTSQTWTETGLNTITKKTNQLPTTVSGWKDSMGSPPRMKTVMANDVVIKCKQCDKKFNRLEWMTNKNCDNPNCSCPEVKKMAAQANTAIQAAKQKAGFHITKKVIPIPTQCDSTKDQYFIEVEPMVVYEIHKSKKK